MILAAAAGMSTWQAAEARQVNVRGIVTDEQGKPLNAVCVFDSETNRLLGATNEDGQYLVVAEDSGKLLFSVLGNEDMEVPVEGRLSIDVILPRESISLQEITVKGKRKLKVVAPEPTDIEMHGNYLTIKTRLRVPSSLFNTSTRLIIQPELWNVTQKSKKYMKPLVFDGWRYHDTQDRMYDSKAATDDPLYKYSALRDNTAKGNPVILYSDSVWIDDPDEDYRCDMLMAMEDYNKVFYRDTTTIARGVVNPLRFFKHSVPGRIITDSAYYPTPEMQLRDGRGDVQLTFDVGRSKLDLDRFGNREALEELLSTLKSVENDPDAAIKSLSIFCTTSPEGSYETNLKLSNARMSSAMETILGELSPATRKYAERSTGSKVESWNMLVDMLRADSHFEEADRVQAIIDQSGHMPDYCQARIKRLPFYRPLITDTYLPRMRRVSYEYVLSQYRSLSDDEIAEMYAKNPASLSKFEYFRLSRKPGLSDAQKEEILRNAIKAHPNFLIASNDLAALLLNKGEADDTLLEQYFADESRRQKLPGDVVLNQVLSLLENKKYAEAYDLVELLPESEEDYRKAQAYAEIYNGHFESAASKVAKESPLNEVLVLLCLKSNDVAWMKAQKLGNSAEEEYVKAIAAERVDEHDRATTHFRNALKLKPELIEIARVDGDVIDLLADYEAQ